MVRGDSQLAPHTPWLHRTMKKFIHGRFIPRFDACLVVGQRAREYYLEYGADPKKMFNCPHFVDNVLFERSSAQWRQKRQELRQSWKLDPAVSTFLFLGKFTPIKRSLDFIKALDFAHRTGAPIQGLMVGDGSMRGEIEEMIRQRSLPIRLTGFLNQSQIPQAYAAADVLVLPSHSESWGLVVNEAMACGLPAIVSNGVGCGPDLIREGITGFTFPVGDVEKLAAIMAKLAWGGEELSAMKRAATQHIQQYSIQQAVEGLLRALEFCAVGRRVIHAL